MQHSWYKPNREYIDGLLNKENHQTLQQFVGKGRKKIYSGNSHSAFTSQLQHPAPIHAFLFSKWERRKKKCSEVSQSSTTNNAFSSIHRQQGMEDFRQNNAQNLPPTTPLWEDDFPVVASFICSNDTPNPLYVSSLQTHGENW